MTSHDCLQWMLDGRRRRVAILLLVMALGPMLVGGLLATPRPANEVALDLGRGKYTYSSPCSATRITVVNQAAQVGLTHTGQLTGGPDYLMRVDGIWQFEEQTDDDPRTLDPIFRETFGARAQLGLDFHWFGFRVGGMVLRQGTVGNEDCNQKACETHVPSYRVTPLPVVAVRLGPRLFHLRWSLADGVWHLAPLAVQSGLSGTVLADGALHSVSYFVGVTTTRETGGFTMGLRLRTRLMVIGARATLQEDNQTMGLTLGARF